MSPRQTSTSSRCLVCCPDSCLLFPLQYSQEQPSSSTAWYTQLLFHHGRRQQIQRGKLSARTRTATSCFVPGTIAQPTTWSIFRVAAMLLPPPVHKTKQCYDRHHGPARVRPFAAAVQPGIQSLFRHRSSRKGDGSTGAGPSSTTHKRDNCRCYRWLCALPRVFRAFVATWNAR
jgi:hypothetical protein